MQLGDSPGIPKEGSLSTRQKTTFQKRQKEMKRQEKQRMKADRRAQRSLAKRTGVPSHEEQIPELETVEPEPQA